VAQQKPPAESKIPPVIIRDASKWPSISSGMKARHIAFTKAKPCVDGIRVNPGTSDDFRALTLLLEERNVPFHSFALPEAKTLRAVLRTVPVEIGLDDVQSDLVDQGLEPIKVSRMTSTRTKKPLPLVLVEVPKDKGQIFQLKTVCHLISVERPHKKGTPSQCHKCQRFHHSQRHWHAQPKCVKCGESHESRACQKTRDAAAKCANCGGPHTASYRGCPRFPRGYLGRKTPQEAPQNPPKNRTNVPLQTRLHVVNALDSDHLPVLMHIGDEANDEYLNTQVQITNWPLFAEILETDFGPIPRIESVEDLENAAGVFEEKSQPP
jgi:hypothetical protein